MFSIYLAAEDQLCAELGTKLINAAGGFSIINTNIYGGNANLRTGISKLHGMASARLAVLIITDLDNSLCSPQLINDWFQPRGLTNSHCLFRVAVKEADAWLLADRENLANFLSVSSAKIPRDCENVHDPKQTLLNIARGSRRRERREGIAPTANSLAKVGPEYNDQLADFVRNYWEIDQAIEHSDSLNRALSALKALAKDLGSKKIPPEVTLY